MPRRRFRLDVRRMRGVRLRWLRSGLECSQKICEPVRVIAESARQGKGNGSLATTAGYPVPRNSQCTLREEDANGVSGGGCVIERGADCNLGKTRFRSPRFEVQVVGSTFSFGDVFVDDGDLIGLRAGIVEN